MWQNKVIFALLTCFVSLSHSFAQPRDVIKTKLLIKFNEHASLKLPEHGLNSSSNSIKTGIASIDKLNETILAKKMKRIFPYAGKFEEKHKKYGLHLWYEVSFNEKTLSALQQTKQYFEADPSVSEVSYSAAPATLSVVDDPAFNLQWHYENTGENDGREDADIDLEAAWAIEMGSPDVTVAIIDGGIQVDHPDLADAMWVNEAELNGIAGVDDDNNGYIDDINGYSFTQKSGTIEPHFHGTHVAGTVGAINNNGKGICGVAGGSSGQGGARLMSCAIFSSGVTDGYDEAFIYAADNGAVIAQCSWGWKDIKYFTQPTIDAINYFIDNAGYDENNEPVGKMQGGLAVFGAGNNGKDEKYYPAYYYKVLAVAATNNRDNKANYSNFGDWVDIAAPGGETFPGYYVNGILSTSSDGQAAYEQGTSMAAPHVSGVAALIISDFEGAGHEPGEVWARLVDNIDDIDQYNYLYQGKLGKGRLNAHKALMDNSCKENLHIDEQIKLEIKTYLASNNLSASNIVSDHAIVHYSGGTVTLLPGFFAEKDVEFHATAKGCDDSQYSLKSDEGLVYEGDSELFPAGQKEKIEISPNPTTGKFNVQNLEEGTSVTVTNSLGLAVFTAPDGYAESEIDLTSQPAGVYTVQLITTDGDAILKKVIRR